MWIRGVVRERDLRCLRSRHPCCRITLWITHGESIFDECVGREGSERSWNVDSVRILKSKVAVECGDLALDLFNPYLVLGVVLREGDC